MNDEPAPKDQAERSWLERIGQFLSGEPKDRQQLAQLLQAASERGLINRDCYAMIDGVMSVEEMQARDIMIPRSQMVIVERDAPLQDFLPTVLGSGHSRFPVIGEDRDEIVGILLAKDLLKYTTDPEAEEFHLRDILRPVIFVPESKRLGVLLKEFRSTRNHLAIVVDEYGGVAGLITIEDILEEIVGDIEDEHDLEDDQSYIRCQAPDKYTVNALTPIEDFNDYFETSLSDSEYDTIGGLIMHGFGHLPRRGESIDIGSFRFTVMQAGKRRIRLLQATPRHLLPPEANNPATKTDKETQTHD